MRALVASMLLTAATLGAQRGPPTPPPRVIRVPPPEPARADTAPAPRARQAAFGTIDGVVTDTSLVPLTTASVTVLSSSVRVETGANGRFRILRVPAGPYLLIVRRVGFRPASGVVLVEPNDTLRLAYALERLPQGLDTVVITEQRRSFRMMEFEYRRRLGFGEFMSQEQIERHNPVYVTDLIRRFTSVGVASSNGGGGMYDHYAVSKRGAASLTTSGPANKQAIGLASCPTSVLVDGVPMPVPVSLDLLPSPRELAGIEVYAGPATVPPQYAPFVRGCGVILVWTKDGG